MFKKLRILILLLVLATVGLSAWRANARLSAWENTIHVAVYPIAADDSSSTIRFVNELKDESFADIGQWMQDQSNRYGRSVLKPVVLWTAPLLHERPPLPPAHAGAFDAIMWSLKLRWWAWHHDRIDGPRPHIRLFVLFHDPERDPVLPHSTGLSKGQIGVIHAFASRLQRKQNAVVIAHELLHTFGATDKYDLVTLQPLYPQGYAEPELNPRLPQHLAEIMGGRIPADEGHAEIPASLSDTVIGPETAREIGLSGPAR